MGPRNCDEAFMTLPARPHEGAPKTQARSNAQRSVAVGLSAAILAVRADEPVVAVVQASPCDRGYEASLPCGLFAPGDTLEGALRAQVLRETGLELNAARQLGAVVDDGDADDDDGRTVVAVTYLALVGPGHEGTGWRSWYGYFPWEDWRHGRPDCLTSDIGPRLEAWARQADEPCRRDQPLDRPQRLRLAFGPDGAWDEEKVLERYELLCEAGLLTDACEDSNEPAVFSRSLPRLRHPLLGDQTRVLASAIAELRRAIKCTPLVFELMGEVFTLYELQKTVEAILGPNLHKQNFRRLVEGCGLVEPTGRYRLRTGGRPAQLYRFRREVVLERMAPGVRVKPGRDRLA
jgi:hypothetical protein